MIHGKHNKYLLICEVDVESIINSKGFIWPTEANMWDQNMSFISYGTKMKTWN